MSDQGPSSQCEATRLQTGLRCPHKARFRVWPEGMRRTPVEEATVVRLVCGTHANSYVFTLGWLCDETVEHPTPKDHANA